MLQIHQFDQFGSEIRTGPEEHQETGFKMDLQQINSGLNQWRGILDLGPKEALINAKVVRKPVQQVVRHKKITGANDGAKINSSGGRIRRKGGKGAQIEQEIQPGNERETEIDFKQEKLRLNDEMNLYVSNIVLHL